MNNLFQRKTFTTHSGKVAHYKIECDALTDEDIETLAWLISKRGDIKEVHGIPRGGDRLAAALRKYCTPSGVTLIVDDVLTTGKSMEVARAKIGQYAVGVVIFARASCPSWIQPLFKNEFISDINLEKD